ncbi:hypothetical protein PSAB6_110037 [Paraburkholderia sabiae]|nr:hypothetical protein PSAB6_110037 [Paraburkholderia sabiae]
MLEKRASNARSGPNGGGHAFRRCEAALEWVLRASCGVIPESLAGRAAGKAHLLCACVPRWGIP